MLLLQLFARPTHSFKYRKINLRQHQQSKSCKAIAAKIKASASQPKITTLLRHVLEQVNARGMGITTTIYKHNAAMGSIVYIGGPCAYRRQGPTP